MHMISDVLIANMLQSIIVAIGIFLYVVAAYGDIRSFHIPNKLVTAVAILGVLRLIVIADPSIAIQTVAITSIVFIVVFLLFWQNLVGGGDAKLITATALLVGYNNLFNFLLLMGICGAVVSLAVLVVRRVSSRSKTGLVVPYGVAIAGGAIVTLLFQPSLIG
jgi:prepilin peptidase CpaA